MVNEMPTPAWKRTRPASAQRVTLTRDVIVAAAIRLLDRDGLDGVSMRRVAEELNTGAASLYAHVANKEELLDLVLDEVCAEVVIPEADPARWQQQLRDVAIQASKVYGAHRDIAVVALGSIPTGPNSLRIAEGMFSILIAGGVPPKVAGWSLDRLALYICADAYEGSILFRRQVESGLSVADFFEQHVGTVREFYSKLPPDRFPTITKYLGDLMGGDSDERFEFGLDMIIRSLETYVPKEPDDPPGTAAALSA
jgi:AcrR family transcriptional regulator